MIESIESKFKKIGGKNERVKIGLHSLNQNFVNAEARHPADPYVQMQIDTNENLDDEMEIGERVLPEHCYEFDRNCLLFVFLFYLFNYLKHKFF